MTVPSPVNALVVAALIFATYMNWSWPWGLLFIFWAVPSIRLGEAFLIGPVPREEQPILFWVVTLLWVTLGVMTLMVDLAPQTLENLFLFMWGY